jgi:PAT family beta-lactamase induction signal transducer AmpG
MAMSNLAIAIAANWQGIAAEALGYPATLLVDAVTGPVCVLLLPAMKRRSEGFTDARTGVRARTTAVVLGLCGLAWLPCWALRESFGKAQPILSTFYTLVFIASALFLLAGREALGQAAGAWRRAALWLAPLLFLMYGRNFLDRLDGLAAVRSVADALVYLVPLAGGVVLLGMATRSWRAVLVDAEAAVDAEVT